VTYPANTRVSAARATQHARLLVAAGTPAEAIAARAGVAPTTVTNLIAGRRTRIYLDTQQAILGVKPMSASGVEGLIDATGARRRLRALTAIGHTLPILARETGISRETLSAIRSGRRPRVHISLDQTITRTYDRLWSSDPVQLGASLNGSARARSYAARNRWAPPAAWDDDEIALRSARPKGLLWVKRKRQAA
jgi:transcriptional regulator with XRE-family HTH domain